MLLAPLAGFVEKVIILLLQSFSINLFRPTFFYYIRCWWVCAAAIGKLIDAVEKGHSAVTTSCWGSFLIAHFNSIDVVAARSLEKCPMLKQTNYSHPFTGCAQSIASHYCVSGMLILYLLAWQGGLRLDPMSFSLIITQCKTKGILVRKGATQVTCSIFEYLENPDLQNWPILVLLIIRMLQLMNGVNKEAAEFL